MHHYVEDVIDLTDPALNRIHNMSVDEARARVLSGNAQAVRKIDGSLALSGARRQNGAAGAVYGPADALFSREAA